MNDEQKTGASRRGVKADDLIKSIEKQQIAPVYFFSGEDDFSKEEALQEFIRTVVEPGTEAFSLDVFTGGETDGATILTVAATLPMLSVRRVIVVKEFQRLPQTDKEAIVRYAGRPNPTTCLILIAPKVDLKTKLYDTLCRHATSVAFPKVYPEHIPAWFQRWTEKHLAKKIDPDAAHALHGIVGDKLGELAGAMRTLEVYVGDRPKITLADVNAVMGASRAGKISEMAHAIGEKDLVKAQRALCTLDAKESLYAVIPALTKHLAILWKIWFLSQMKRSDEDIKGTLKLSWWFNKDFSKYMAQARRLSRADLHDGFEALLRADLAMKTSVQTPRLILEMLLYELCCVEHHVKEIV